MYLPLSQLDHRYSSSKFACETPESHAFLDVEPFRCSEAAEAAPDELSPRSILDCLKECGEHVCPLTQQRTTTPRPVSTSSLFRCCVLVQAHRMKLVTSGNEKPTSFSKIVTCICKHYTKPTHTSHSRTRDFSRVAQELSHRVHKNRCVSQHSHSSHLAQHVARAFVVVSFTLQHYFTFHMHSSPTIYPSFVAVHFTRRFTLRGSIELCLSVPWLKRIRPHYQRYRIHLARLPRIHDREAIKEHSFIQLPFAETGKDPTPKNSFRQDHLPEHVQRH